MFYFEELFKSILLSKRILLLNFKYEFGSFKKVDKITGKKPVKVCVKPKVELRSQLEGLFDLHQLRKLHVDHQQVKHVHHLGC